MTMTARPWSPLSLPLVLYFFIFNSEKQIRIVFERNTRTWSEMKAIVANILTEEASNLVFLDFITLGNVDNEDDGSCGFVHKLAVYSCIVKNKINHSTSLPSLTVYDANDKEIMFLSKPYLFRSKA